jgi:hypothetical protein
MNSDTRQAMDALAHYILTAAVEEDWDKVRDLSNTIVAAMRRMPEYDPGDIILSWVDETARVMRWERELFADIDGIIFASAIDGRDLDADNEVAAPQRWAARIVFARLTRNFDNFAALLSVLHDPEKGKWIDCLLSLLASTIRDGIPGVFVLLD